MSDCNTCVLPDEIKDLRQELTAATERNGNLCVELAAMRQSRNAADDEATRLSIELAAAKLDRDSLRREVAALVCAEIIEGNCPRGDWACVRDESGFCLCPNCWAAWAKQAAQAGKDVKP